MQDLRISSTLLMSLAVGLRVEGLGAGTYNKRAARRKTHARLSP